MGVVSAVIHAQAYNLELFVPLAFFISKSPRVRRLLGTLRQKVQAYEAYEAYQGVRMGAAAKFRSSVVWQRFRDWYKREHPLCVDPFRDHPHEVRPVEDVHHVLGLAERLDLGLDADNCRSLCRACHAKVEGMARAGRPTAQLFGAPQGGSASPGA